MKAVVAFIRCFIVEKEVRKPTKYRPVHVEALLWFSVFTVSLALSGISTLLTLPMYSAMKVVGSWMNEEPAAHIISTGRYVVYTVLHLMLVSIVLVDSG